MKIQEGPAAKVTLWLVAIIGLIIIYAPPLFLLGVSFNPELQPGLPKLADVTLRWYLELSEETRLTNALRESLFIATWTALIATALALSATLAYFELVHTKTAWFMTVLLPMFVPGVIQGLALSTVFRQVGISPSSYTVIASHLMWAMPFAFIVILTSFSAVKHHYLLAAADLGATWRQRFLDVILPLIAPGLVSAFLFSFLLSLNEFSRAVYLSGAQNTLPVTLFGLMNSGASPTIYAMSGLILLISLLVGTLVIAFVLFRAAHKPVAK